MKRLFTSVIAAIMLVLSVMFAAGCSDPGAPAHDTLAPEYSIAPSVIETKLEEFLAGRQDRTTYTDGERLAAEYLAAQLVSFGYDDASVLDFNVDDDTVGTLKSRNVAAVYTPDGIDETAKNVVMGAYYDNRYTAPFKGAATWMGSHGALSNGTGVATLLALAEYYMTQKPALDFTVTFVFFGATAVNNKGAEYYYLHQMTAAQKTNTVLMIELQRLGGDHLYSFSDVRETGREGFFDRIAAENSLDIYKPTQKSPAIIGWSALNGVPFFQWAHGGAFPVFFSANIPTLSLIGGNWETIDLTDTESASNANISTTKSDDLETLKRVYPDYGIKAATAATLITRSLSDSRFLKTMQYDRDNFPDTGILVKAWIWYLVALGIIILTVLAVMLVSAHLSVKYPIEQLKPQRMKMAVFGMDYEDKDSGDIFVDIKPASVDDDIFPGIPNNDADSVPFGGIFGPFAMGGVKPPGAPAENKSDSADDDIFAAPTEQKAQDPAAPTEPEPEKKTEPEKEPEPDRPDVGESKAKETPEAEDRADAETPAPAEKAAPAKRPSAAKKPAARPASHTLDNKPAKRSTTSAGKSANAGKKKSAEEKPGEEDESAGQ